MQVGKEEAQEYLNEQYKEPAGTSGADNDLRGKDFEIASSNLGLDQDWRILFHQPSCRTLISTTMTYFQNI